MFELIQKYGLTFYAEPGEHLWTFTIRGTNGNGQPQTEMYTADVDGEDAVRAEATRAVEQYVKTCGPKEL